MSPAQICGGVGAERRRPREAARKGNAGANARPETLAEIRKVVARPAPRIMNYAEAAAKLKTAAAVKDPGPHKTWYRTHSHRLPFENHTAEHVITKLRGWWTGDGWPWTG
ncbi:hypothetical protein EVAR_90459_1 [Eumeta japonica]|uniref:Uncharacterized protein n=1 Tax=Eumeta variegata TaxID=151549 RepID=A0A4C1SHL9_EUMVA|nr:hypothetical protein EVAR_90459_1 [Eumeta japonica]